MNYMIVDPILADFKSKRGAHHVRITYGKEPKGRYPWSVQYCGSGYYFRDLYAALCYCYGRGFIDRYEIERKEKEILEKMKESGLHN